MGDELAIDLSQNIENNLSKFAEEQRAKLLPKNEYKDIAFEYSSKNPNALGDGDDKGRGNGVFLDTYSQTIGTKQDIAERKSELKINKFKGTNPYPDFKFNK
jgi:hypothetical protein